MASQPPVDVAAHPGVRRRQVTVAWVPEPGYPDEQVDLVVDAAIQRALHRLRNDLAPVAAELTVEASRA